MCTGRQALSHANQKRRISGQENRLILLTDTVFSNRSPDMGSMVYAKHLKEQGTAVEVMVSLEMIGFFSEERIQRYRKTGEGASWLKLFWL